VYTELKFEGDKMSDLLSAIEELRSEVLVDLPDARAEEDFAEVQRAAEMLEVERPSPCGR
jgi:hypothetical protein